MTYAGTIVDTRTYDNGGRMTASVYNNGVGEVRTYKADNTLAAINFSGAAIGNLSYGWDANKNKTAETIGGTMSGYGFTIPGGGYDTEDRLVSYVRTDGAMNQSWNLSPVGDWTSFTENAVVQNRTHGSTHELTAIDAITLAHDSKGNLTQNSNTQTYTWDFDNRMSQTIVPASSPGLQGTHAYSYDALGRRVTKSIDTNADGIPDATTVFVCKISPLQYSPSAGQVLAEYPSGALPSSPDRKFVFASYIDEPILLIDRTSLGVLPAGTDEPFYYHQNSLYSVAALTDSLGAITERYAYTAYGATTFLTPSGVPLATQTSTIGNPYTYTARRIDQETQLHYYRARYYNHENGRLLNRDPIAYQAGNLNLYEYVGSQPINFIDPSGTIVFIPWFPGSPPAQEFPPFRIPFIDNAYHLRAFMDLLSSLSSMCIGCDTCNYDQPGEGIDPRTLNKPVNTGTECDPAECMAEAVDMAKSVYYTLRNNFRYRLYGSYYNGYMCWEWAFAFDDAAEAASPSNCFSSKIQSSSKWDFFVHYWIEISSPCSDTSVYVDDGFGAFPRGVRFVHATPPDCSNIGYVPGAESGGWPYPGVPNPVEPNGPDGHPIPNSPTP